MGELLKQGWKPKRTILFCAWDGEEPGLLGSTEWVETHQDELRQKGVMYINSDTNGRGFLGIDGSHTLEHFINGVERDVPDPETKLTVWKRAQLYQIAHPDGADSDRDEARSREDLRVGALGDGSDYVPFVHYIGIASLDLGFGGEDGGGIYHSDLRRFLLVYAFFRHQFCLWSCALADCRYGADAHGRRGNAALRLP